MCVHIECLFISLIIVPKLNRNMFFVETLHGNSHNFEFGHGSIRWISFLSFSIIRHCLWLLSKICVCVCVFQYSPVITVLIAQAIPWLSDNIEIERKVESSCFRFFLFQSNKSKHNERKKTITHWSTRRFLFASLFTSISSLFLHVSFDSLCLAVRLCSPELYIDPCEMVE